MGSDDVSVKTPSAKLTDLNIKLAKSRDGGSHLIRNFFALGVNYVQRNWDVLDDGEGPKWREGEA